MGTTRREELKIRLRLSPFSQRGPLTDERRRTATSMQNALTFKFRRWRRRRRKPLDGIRRFTDSLEEGGNRSSGTASSDEDNSSFSQKGLLTNDRRRTATATPTPTLTTTATSRTKTTSLEVEIARRGSSSHGLIRRTGRWRYGKINIGTSSTGSWRHLDEDVGDLKDIRRWEA